MNRQAERAVWDRVIACPSLTAEQALLPERLSELMTQERAFADACTQLAARLTGADSAALRRLRAQAMTRQQQLNALRFLYTGLRSELRPAHVPFHSSVCDALREAGLQLLAVKAAYEKTAAEFSAQREALEQLCTQVRQATQTVMGILQRSL